MNNKQLEYQDEREGFQQRLDFINAHRHPISILLDGVGDARNIGSVFRLADAANLKCLYFYNCPIVPNDKRIKKTSRSTHKYVPHQILSNIDEVLALKSTHQFIALEITSQSQVYTNIKIQKPSIIIVGAESQGVSKQLLEIVDLTVHIPMYGINTSMNVINAASIVTYHFLQSYSS